MHRTSSRTALALAATLLVASLSCRTVKFYTQAVGGQMEVLRKARPLAEVRANPTTSAKLARQLDLVQEIRIYAHAHLKLPTDRQYRTYADLGRPFVVWNVVAAPEFSLEAKTWTYPFVGKLKYRGFFNENDAREEEARVQAQGYDVAVGGVRVYSTLGVFCDPVLNTFINEADAELAETLFHELTHARFFVSGDTDFNEAYATAAAQIGVRQWLRAKGDSAALRRYEAEQARIRNVLDLLKATRARLSTLYAQQDTLPIDRLRQGKADILDDARARHLALQRLRPPSRQQVQVQGQTSPTPLSRRLNNARLAAVATYHDLVPAFTRLFHEVGGDWEKFHQTVASMKTLTKAQRRERLGVPDTSQPGAIPPCPRPNPS